MGNAGHSPYRLEGFLGVEKKGGEERFEALQGAKPKWECPRETRRGSEWVFL